MCTYFKTEADAVKKLIDDVFSNFGLSEDLSIGRILRGKKYGGMGLISEKERRFCTQNLTK